MATLRRALSIVLTLAVLAFASMPASAAQSRVVVTSQVALDWNLNAVNVVRAYRWPTTGAAYFQLEGLIYMSYVQAAVYDAVTKISGRYVPYHAFAADAAGASADAAVIAATYRTLLHYQGDLVVDLTTLTAKYDRAVADLPPTGKAKGIAVGEAAANDLIAFRANDGRNGVGTNCPYVPPTALTAGVWQPPAAGAQTPWAACMTPFLLNSAAQFRAGPPPALASSDYAADFNETKSYGAFNSTVRSADQKATAYFWNANVISQANKALRDTVTKHNLDLVDAVRLLAMGDLVVTDAGIACFDSKYHYLFWRPIAAIQHADIDGNSRTDADPAWTPTLGTPNHPEYPAAHGCVTSAFAMTVAIAFQTEHIDVDVPGAADGATTLTTTRHFATVEDITTEIVNARVWIGFHYRNSAIAGVDLGTNVASWTLERFFGRVQADDHHGDGAASGTGGNPPETTEGDDDARDEGED
jgi:hypothetical protein